MFVSQLPFHCSRRFNVVASFASVGIELFKPSFDSKILPKALFSPLEITNVTLCNNQSFLRNSLLFAQLSCCSYPRVLSTLRPASFAWCSRMAGVVLRLKGTCSASSSSPGRTRNPVCTAASPLPALFPSSFASSQCLPSTTALKLRPEFTRDQILYLIRCFP